MSNSFCRILLRRTNSCSEIISASLYPTQTQIKMIASLLNTFCEGCSSFSSSPSVQSYLHLLWTPSLNFPLYHLSPISQLPLLQLDHHYGSMINSTSSGPAALKLLRGIKFSAFHSSMSVVERSWHRDFWSIFQPIGFNIRLKKDRIFQRNIFQTFSNVIIPL